MTPHDANTSDHVATFPGKKLIRDVDYEPPHCASHTHNLFKNQLFEWVQPRHDPLVLRSDMWLRSSDVLSGIIMIQRHSPHHPRGLPSFISGWRTRRWNGSPVLVRIDLRAVVRRLVDWRWHMISIVGYTVSVIPTYQLPRTLPGGGYACIW